MAVRGALDLIAKAGGGVVEGYPHDLQGEKIRSQFLYSATRSLFEEVGFRYERPKGKKNCVMRTAVLPSKPLDGLASGVAGGFVARATFPHALAREHDLLAWTRRKRRSACAA